VRTMAGARPFAALRHHMCVTRTRNGLPQKPHTTSSPCPSVPLDYKFHDMRGDSQNGATTVNDYKNIVFLSFRKPTSLGPTRTTSPRFISAQAVNE
jgi:hypothetical protein